MKFSVYQPFQREPLGHLEINRTVVQSNLNMIDERFNNLGVHDDLTSDEKELQVILTDLRPFLLSIYQWMTRDAIEVVVISSSSKNEHFSIGTIVKIDLVLKSGISSTTT